MRLYPEEWECARLYQSEQAVPRLTESQLQHVRDVGKKYAKWYRAHPYVHNGISVCVLLLLFSVDLLALLILPRLLLGDGGSTARWIAAVICTSAVHGFVFYSTVIYTMHEGAAHNRIIQAVGPLTRALAFLANNACRVFYADPVYYRSRHTHHHADFGTEDDGAFTNFVHPRRFWISLLPMAGLLDFNDYKIHSDVQFSRSRLVSFLVGSVYTIAVGVLMAPQFGVLFAVVVLVFLSPWAAFVLDRLRETTEHNLMALETPNGARDLGCGFWGLLIGGGPWGQPCHLSHHLIPALPWYQQCLLHRRLLAIMTAQQRRYFTIPPIAGFPRLLYCVVTENHRWLAAFRKSIHEPLSTQHSA